MKESPFKLEAHGALQRPDLDNKEALVAHLTNAVAQNPIGDKLLSCKVNPKPLVGIWHIEVEILGEFREVAINRFRQLFATRIWDTFTIFEEEDDG